MEGMIISPNGTNLCSPNNSIIVDWILSFSVELMGREGN